MLDAALGEIITTCSKLDWLINHGERALSPEKRSNNLIMFYKSSYVYYEPLGVVSAIVSWNYRGCLCLTSCCSVLHLVWCMQRCTIRGHQSWPLFLRETASS